MKVLQVNCVFRKGSTGRITDDLHLYYKSVGIDSHVAYGRGEAIKEPCVYKVAWDIPSKIRNLISRFTGNLYGMGKGGVRNIVSLIERLEPDVVHLQCINGYFVDIYALLDYLKTQKVKTLITLHAEFMHTGNCGYSFDCDGWKTGCQNCPDARCAISSRNPSAPRKNWLKMKKAFCGFDTLSLVGVSNWVSGRARLSPIMEGKKIGTVLNGIDDTVFYHREEVPALIEEIHARGRKALLFVTPYFDDENKGGEHLLELAEKMAGAPVEFVVIGHGGHAHGRENLHFVGEVLDPAELAGWYSGADLTLLLSRRETFSMICAETLSCGTPIVGFRAGAPELIALSEYSEFVPYGDLDALTEAVGRWLQKDLDKSEISAVARRVYSQKVMAENYIKEYEKLLEAN